MISISVRHRETSMPISGQRLSIEFGGSVAGWTKMVETDLEGEAYFKVAPVTEGTLFINGHRFYQGHIEDGMVVYLGD